MTAARETRISRYADLADALHALGHVHRLQILQATSTQPRSPREVAELIDVPLGSVAYHFRVMVTAGLLELDHEERVRGSVKHVYRLTRKGRHLHRVLVDETEPGP